MCKYLFAFLLFGCGLARATVNNVIANPSFEYPAAGDQTKADGWTVHNFWPGGYVRKQVTDAYDGKWVIELSNPKGKTVARAGAAIRKKFSTPTTLPLRIRGFVRGWVENPGNSHHAVNLYCEITYADGTKFYGPPWQMTTHNGMMPHWREVGFNTHHITNKPVREVFCVAELTATGIVQFDDILIEEFVPLQRAIASIQGDDGYVSQYNNLLPILKSYGYRGSIAVIGGKIGQPNYMHEWQLKELQNVHKWPLESHTWTHRDLSTLSTDQMQSEVWWSWSELNRRGLFVRDLVLPLGSYDARVMEYAQWFHPSVRNVWRNANPAGTFKLDVRTYELQNTTTLDDVHRWIDDGIRTRQWVNLMVHEVLDACPAGDAGKYCTTKWMVNMMCAYLLSKGVQVLPHREAFDLTQKAQ